MSKVVIISPKTELGYRVKIEDYRTKTEYVRRFDNPRQTRRFLNKLGVKRRIDWGSQWSQQFTLETEEFVHESSPNGCAEGCLACELERET